MKIRQSQYHSYRKNPLIQKSTLSRGINRKLCLYCENSTISI
nr:MAG TPA: cryptochrome-1 [Caudoviricetes sp.]